MHHPHWKERWPDLSYFLEEHVAYTITHYGVGYYTDLETAWCRGYIPAFCENLGQMRYHLKDNAQKRRNDVIAELDRWIRLLMDEYTKEQRPDAEDSKT